MFWGAFSAEQSKNDRLKRHPQAVEMPKSEMFLAALTHILRHDYGFIRSVEIGEAQAQDGSPLPLFTYPAIEYLSQLDFRQSSVFEYGAGGSTHFWAARAKSVTSVENNAQWVAQLEEKLAENVHLIFRGGDAFPWTIEETEECFDVIVVDSAGYRYDCATAALKRLAKGGMIILDNADWHPNTAAQLRNADLIQVDMTGFKPGECHTSTTSLFLHRDFNLQSLHQQQPIFGRGAKWIHSEAWDKPYAKK
ncbi:SAM-dependent methyltransferase [Pseudidiomarina sediminum]|uniref:SAM-dependent methyltransferase n=1 Tax=Pseudidiomarina sediminum TaxID=431675 RepID=A0A432Z938_9GAMM|nr:class I SAM-dependent methyltransferase [Pseudidiomarina sediminum]MBY6063607.1 class I SAM-dependent methyltransferase [Pseudidiomarina sediminum]RUO74429.1 SAM-dependent methyltransferase [Pseudidiomarina sediminum]